MKRIVGSVLLFCASCLDTTGSAGRLQAGEEAIHADTAPLRPPVRSITPLNPRPAGAFDTWSLSLQEEFFRQQAAQRSAPVGAFMAMPASAFDGDRNRFLSAASSRSAGDVVGAFPWNSLPNLIPAPDLTAAALPRFDMQTLSGFQQSPWLAAAGVDFQQGHLNVNPALDGLWNQVQAAQVAPRLHDGIGDLRAWLASPDAAARVDQAKHWLTDQAQAVAKQSDHLDANSADGLRLAATTWLNKQLSATGLDSQIPADPSLRLTGLPASGSAGLNAVLQTQVDRLNALPTELLLQDARRVLDSLDRLVDSLPASGGTPLSGLSVALPPLNPSLRGLDFQARNLRLGANAAAVDRIDFSLGGTRFNLSNAAWLQQRTASGMQQSLLSVGPTAWTFKAGQSAQFTDFRFELLTGPDSFRATGSVSGLDVQLSKTRIHVDAAAFALTRDAGGLRFQAMVYPHDPRYARGGVPGGINNSSCGVYFEATSGNLRVLQELTAIFGDSTAGLNGSNVLDGSSLDRLAALVAERPHLFDDNYRIIFSGRAARMLAAEWGRPLEPGTRLLIDALAGFDNSDRTFAVEGRQVARLSSLAADRRYSDMIDVAREIVPEIDVLYSHMLRRIAGRPDSLARPVTLSRLGDLETVLGAANGDYSTQWFVGVAWQVQPAQGFWSQRLQAGWLYEQSGVVDGLDGVNAAQDAFALAQYNFERAGFLQYRANGWVAELETALHPRISLGQARTVAFNATLDLGLRQADYISFADQADFARPKEFLARYDQPSPLGNLFPIFHAETGVQMEWRPQPNAPAGGWTRRLGVGCDADAGYGAVAHALRQQLPIVPELTPKAFASLERPGSRIQMVAAWPTAADRAPYAACQVAWAWGAE